MNYIDIVILLFLLYGAFRGFSKGLIIEVATLAGLILGVFIAIRYSPFTEGIFKLLGTLLGIAKYFIMVCVLLMIVDALNDKFHFISEETRENSLLFDPFLNFAQQMYNTIRF